MTRRLVLLAAVVCSALFAAEDFFFIQLTDPQFGMYASNKGFEQETANLEFAVAAVNRLKPAFVVVTGDLIHQDGNAQQLAEYRRIMAKVRPETPVYSLPGNHDVGLEPTAESLAAYRKALGKDYYSFRSGPVYGIVLNSPLIYSPAKAPGEFQKQESWLRAELKNAKASGAPHIIVFQHHPFFIKEVDEKDVYENIPRERRTAYLNLLRDHGVKFVFTGHYHQNAASHYGDMEIVVTGPVGKPLRGAKSGFRVVKITPAGVEHKYYDFGDLPAKP
jgi:3',5'-cyclic AMP phosphodiesterase CpdA